MDKRIHTLIFIYVIYLLIALTMVFIPNGWQFMTMLLFSVSGLGLFFVFFFLWLLARKD